MDHPNDYLEFSNLDYGCYIFQELRIETENVKWATAEFDKLYVRRIRLPDGRGNVIYLLSDSFENSLKMVGSEHFLIPPTYRKFFYPWISFGGFMGRRYKLHLTKERQERVKLIKEKTKLIPYATRNLQKTTENVFFSAADLYDIVTPIIQRFPVKRIFSEFFTEFDGILSGMTPEIAKPKEDKAWNNRLMIIDADAFGFKMGGSLEENKTNPLFMIYLAFLRTRTLATLGVDRDMLITSKNMFLKFNPARITPEKWQKFRIALFKIMKANLDDYTANLTPEEQEELAISSEDYITRSIVDETIKPFTQYTSPAIKGVVADAVDSSLKQQVMVKDAMFRIQREEQEAIAREIDPNVKKNDIFSQVVIPPTKGTSIIDPPVNAHLSAKRARLFDAIIRDYQPLCHQTQGVSPSDKKLIQDHEEEIQSDVRQILQEDEGVKEEIVDEIQSRVAPMKDLETAPVMSARDKKLREAQKQIVVKNSTIQEILAKDSSNVPIKSDNKSAVLTTSNQNMHNVTFSNFDKTYIEELYTKDLLSCFNMLQDKVSPFYITGINIEDSSDVMNLQETWTVSMTDENKKRHTIKVDIPKFYQNRFMLIGGNKYIILKQNFYNPLVKDTNDTVIMTTNFNKVTIQRKDTKSLVTVERIFSVIRKTDDDKVFVTGDSSQANLNARYLNSLEYDELSRRLFKFSSNGCDLYFSRHYIDENLEKPVGIKGNEFFIGTENGAPVLINEDTGRDRHDRTIAEIIYQNLSDEYKVIHDSIKPGKRSMFADSKIAGQWIPVGVILIIWCGISRMLDRMGMRWEFHPDMKRKPKDAPPNVEYIKFADGMLEYQPELFAQLILNGISKLNPERFNFNDFNGESGYVDYIYSVWGNYTGITQIKTFYEFLLDPITKDVCRDLFLPTEIDALLIHAVKLLCDNKSVSKASDKSYRVRSVETIAAILYSQIALQYQKYVTGGRSRSMSLDQRVVIKQLQAIKTVDEYSTLNPAIEVGKMHTISTKGYRGSNSEHSYDEEKRSYDPSSIGKIAMSTSNDANVGINRELVVEPTLTSARGYRNPVKEEDLEALRDVNVFSPVEMLTPGTARNDDPIRTAIANKQSQHLVPVANASPALISNGYDEALQFHLSNDFVINAEEDGKVVEIDEDTGFMVVQYKSGKTQAINTKPEVVKNSGGGFYISNQLKPVLTRVGASFKKDEVLAYHDKYFKHSKMNGLRYAIGPLVKMAFMSTYNTYEDAGICTSKLANMMKTFIVYPEIATFKKNSNILQMVKIGDKVGIGDSLIKYDTSFEDAEISRYLTRLSEENRSRLEEETKNDIKANHAGEVIDIKVYTLHDPENLSPSLGKVVQQYFNKGKNKKKFLEKYDRSPGIIKAGYMLTDNTEPIVTRYNDIKKYKGIDVLIEIFIEHSDVMGVGDKIALYGPNKQIVSELIPDGYEPYSDFRPDEEISVITSPGTIARRMTSSVIPISMAMKCMIELKRKIKDEIRFS